MDILPPLAAIRVERLKCLNTERDRVMELYLGDRASLDMKYLDLCKPLYKEIGNFFARRLDENIERIHKDGGGKKEEEGSNGDDDDGDDSTGGGRGEGGGRIPGGRLRQRRRVCDGRDRRSTTPSSPYSRASQMSQYGEREGNGTISN